MSRRKTPKEHNEAIGIVVKALRKQAGYTQLAFSKVVGLNRTTLVNIEKGRQALSTFQLMKIKEALNLQSVDQFFPNDPNVSQQYSEVIVTSLYPLTPKQEEEVRRVVSTVA